MAPICFRKLLGDSLIGSRSHCQDYRASSSILERSDLGKRALPRTLPSHLASFTVSMSSREDAVRPTIIVCSRKDTLPFLYTSFLLTYSLCLSLCLSDLYPISVNLLSRYTNFRLNSKIHRGLYRFILTSINC